MELSSIAPTSRSEEWVLKKVEFFVKVRAWPLRAELDPRRWLSNFRKHERDAAVHILDQFLYFSEELLDAAFMAGFQRISMSLLNSRRPLDLTQKWNEFLSAVLVAPVQGEEDSIADSGRVFGRKARQVFGLNEENILDPYEASQHAKSSGRPLVLVDDFVGTGQQMITMWDTLCLKSLARSGVSLFYAPALATEYGRRAILTHCSGLNLSEGQLIPSEYSATSKGSILWPTGRAEEYLNILKSASLRAGIPDTEGASVNDWQGFHKLGLALAMHGSVPDATMALFRWEENGWNPLIRKK